MLKEHGIKMGRDQLFDLLRFHGLLIRRRKRGMMEISPKQPPLDQSKLPPADRLKLPPPFLI